MATLPDHDDNDATESPWGRVRDLLSRHFGDDADCAEIAETPRHCGVSASEKSFTKR